MSRTLGRRLAFALAPPSYLAAPAVGIELSSSSIKLAIVSDSPAGLLLTGHTDIRIPPGSYVDGDIVDASTIAAILGALAKQNRFHTANTSLPEAHAYLFETTVKGHTPSTWHSEVDERLTELIPLPPFETAFDVVPSGQSSTGEMSMTGIGYSKRAIDETLALYDEAGLTLASLESELFAIARALLPRGDQSTVLVVDIGRSTMKIGVVASRTPRFSTTVQSGGHPFTLAVQKHFGVTEEDARKIKIEQGLTSHSSMMHTASTIKDEILRGLTQWRESKLANAHDPISKIFLIGGNASVKGLPEYLEQELRIPVVLGDVFVNFAPRGAWLPPIDQAESLAYATAIGLALRDFEYEH